MNVLASAALAALAILSAEAEATPAPARVPSALPAGLVEVEGHPLGIAVLEPPEGGIDVLLLTGRDVERFRLAGRTLERVGRFRAPVKRARPLLLDAGKAGTGRAPIVTAVLGDDVHSVDQGTDTALHAWVLSPTADGGLVPASGDLEAYLRIAGGGVYLQRRGAYETHAGPVRAVEDASGRFTPSRAAVPWASRWLLEATPLPGGKEALAWDGGAPVVVKLEGGERVPGGTILGDLGAVREPSVAIRLKQPIFKMGMDKEGRVNETWHALPRRVAISADGGIYCIERGRTKGMPVFGKKTGQDAVVRLDVSERALDLSRPLPAVDAYVLDFALVERPGRPPAALLLVNEEDDGSGRAHLVAQEPR